MKTSKLICTAMAALTLITGTAAPTVIPVVGSELSTAIVMEASAAYATGTYKVNTPSGVNVRRGAGTKYGVVDASPNGTTFNVTKINGSWGYTSSISCNNGKKSGWVCLDYCKKINNNNNNQVVGKYSFSKAYNYAKKYWNTRNNAYNYYNGNNCANFVSQCLVASGIPTTAQWKNGEAAFINCTSLKNHFTGRFSNVKYISNPGIGSIKKGDVIYTNQGGHVMFVMNVANGRVYASGNTNNRDCISVGFGGNGICGVLKTGNLMK